MRNGKLCYLILFFLTILLAECSTSAKRINAAPEERKKSVNLTDESKERKVSGLIKPADFTPPPPEKITFRDNALLIEVYSRKFAQGNAVYAVITRLDNSTIGDIALIYKKETVPLTATSGGFRALWGINPEEKPGKYKVIISYRSGGVEKKLSKEIRIRDVVYPVSKKKLNVGKFSDRDYTSSPEFRELIAECSRLRKEAFASVSEDSIGNRFSHPRDMHKITGDYWRKRIYLKYRKRNGKRVTVEGSRSYHRGVDLKGAVGAPVYAMADGVIVLSHDMFFEGKMVVIDHGNGVFSYYQHLDSRMVKTGDRVRAGDVIGGVGASGMVTGPHLHVAFSIRGVHVDPLSLLSLPVSR